MAIGINYMVKGRRAKPNIQPTSIKPHHRLRAAPGPLFPRSPPTSARIPVPTPDRQQNNPFLDAVNQLASANLLANPELVYLGRLYERGELGEEDEERFFWLREEERRNRSMTSRTSWGVYGRVADENEEGESSIEREWEAMLQEESDSGVRVISDPPAPPQDRKRKIDQLFSTSLLEGLEFQTPHPSHPPRPSRRLPLEPSRPVRHLLKSGRDSQDDWIEEYFDPAQPTKKNGNESNDRGDDLLRPVDEQSCDTGETDISRRRIRSDEDVLIHPARPTRYLTDSTDATSYSSRRSSLLSTTSPDPYVGKHASSGSSR